MRITESRLRRYIKSVINETNKWEREVLNRKRKGEPYLPLPPKSQEEIQTEEYAKRLERVAEICAKNLVQLYSSYPEAKDGEWYPASQEQKYDDGRRKKKVLRKSVSLAGHNASTEHHRKTGRDLLMKDLKKLNKSMADAVNKEYLEDDNFWERLYLKFESGIDDIFYKNL